MTVTNNLLQKSAGMTAFQDFFRKTFWQQYCSETKKSKN